MRNNIDVVLAQNTTNPAPDKIALQNIWNDKEHETSQLETKYRSCEQNTTPTLRWRPPAMQQNEDLLIGKSPWRCINATVQRIECCWKTSRS